MNRMSSQGFRSLDSRIIWEESHPTRNTLNGLDQKLESWETWVRSLGWEDPLEKGMAIHSSILPGEFHGQRSLAGYSLWGHKKSDTTE